MVDLLFDARHIRQSGIGTYIRNLLPHLENTFAARGLSLAVLVGEHSDGPSRDSTTVIVAHEAAPMYSLGEQRVWDRTLNTLRPKGFWVPHYPFPLALLYPKNRDTKLFVTVHDMSHVVRKEVSGHNFARRMYARTMLTLDVRRCRRIFTPSQATASALTSFASGAPAMVTPIPVGEEWLRPSDPALSPVAGPYLLYVGNAKWHKNLPLLLNAYSDVAQEVPHMLVIAGSGESLRAGDERVAVLAEQQGDRVQVMGRLNFDVLRSLVAGADLLVMPSLYEGAGLPPIEAMASHTAVLASNIPSLRETCGDGADYFDPYDRRGLAALLRKYCLDGGATAALAARGWSHVTARQSGLSLLPAAEEVAEELA